VVVWIVGYIVGAGAMAGYVVWSCIDYPLPRTWTSIVHIVLGVLFWPVTTVVIIGGFVYALASEVMFEPTTKTSTAINTTALTSLNATWRRV